ncbi:MAG: helix-turn-helix domain-containing protein [Proteobacteria bacterium]|nr:helix-turn-helix domain-containing protein [Pseudomonadota bacterium]
MESDPYLSEAKVAQRWGFSQKTLQRWRLDRTGPDFLKLGRVIRYRLCDIEAFEQMAFTKCYGNRINNSKLCGHENKPPQAAPRLTTVDIDDHPRHNVSEFHK